MGLTEDLWEAAYIFEANAPTSGAFLTESQKRILDIVRRKREAERKPRFTSRLMTLGMYHVFDGCKFLCETITGEEAERIVEALSLKEGKWL